MKFTSASSILFLSCFHASSAFLHNTLVQRSASFSPSACSTGAKVLPSSTLCASTADGVDMEGDMLGLFGDDDPDEDEIAVFKDADIIFSLIDVDGNGAATMEEVANH